MNTNDRQRRSGSGAMQVRLSAAVAVSLLGCAAQAQDEAKDDTLETVSVTASRVVVSGFSAPTPTMIVGEEEMARTAPLQISEALQQIPTFRTSGTSSTANVYANLRAIGAQRTLLLVDGRRHVPTQSDGSVDLNLVP